MKKVVILCALLSASCRSDALRDKAVVIRDVARDTTVRLVKTQGNRSPSISLCAVGSLDDSATVTLRNPRQPEKLYWQTWRLPKGRLDSLKQRLDYYDHDVDVIYSHRNVSRGKLSLTVRY
ncbi:hypothetical protein CLV58_1393 [Spirosoma oryzae]|uniref:Uncharacterized protein n=1 Tax=Spirosoma oryzae TaxID=1469603 RepID=A0A2T0RTM0_9BACT|nr:hypothetical protein [Spirosoma oryzae]PRY24535.1 hypothetical protein CLV58_1393 [Spirosoma oryzae]